MYAYKNLYKIYMYAMFYKDLGVFSPNFRQRIQWLFLGNNGGKGVMTWSFTFSIICFYIN